MCDSHCILVLSQSGEVLRQQQLTCPRYITVAANDVLYVADWQTGIFESTDGGYNWNQPFQLPRGANYCQVIKLPAEYGEVFWVVEYCNGAWNIREYCINRRIRHNHTAWCGKICLRIEEKKNSSNTKRKVKKGKDIDLLHASILYDGDITVFVANLNNDDIHLFSVNGEHERRLLSNTDGICNPCSLAVDRTRQRLCVGQNGEVKVFLLNDGRWHLELMLDNTGQWRSSAFSETTYI